MEKGWLEYKIYKEDVKQITDFILKQYEGKGFSVKYGKIGIYDYFKFHLYKDNELYVSFDMNDIVFKGLIKTNKEYRRKLIAKYLYLNRNYKEDLITVVNDKKFIYKLTGSNLEIKNSNYNFILDNTIFIDCQSDNISLMDYKHSLQVICQTEVENGFTKNKRKK